MPQGYAEWYEAVRESDRVSSDQIEDMSAEQALQEFLDKSPSQSQLQAIAEQQKQADKNEFSVRNIVSSGRETSIPSEVLERPVDLSETFVSTSQGNISLDEIAGAFKRNGKIWIQTESADSPTGYKVFGTIDL